MNTLSNGTLLRLADYLEGRTGFHFPKKKGGGEHLCDTPFLGLVQNASLLLAAAFIFNVATTRWHTGQTSFQRVVVGIALGAIGIIIMLTPMKFMPGVVFDTRSVLIGISGLFFGSFSTMIAVAITGAFRFYLGGTGVWTGIIVIFVSGMIGVGWQHFRRLSLAGISFRELYLFGIVIHLAMLTAMLTLPWETALRVLSNISLPVLVIYPLGTALLGALMVNRLRRERAEEELVFNNIILRTQQESSIDGILVVDENGKILSFNQRLVELWGIPPDVIESRSDKRALQSVTDKLADPEGFIHKVKLLYESRHETSRDEIFLKDGRSFDRYSAPMLGAHGKYYGRVWYFRDITERKRVEEDLKQTMGKLRKNLVGTIRAMSLTVETRDPYTAGHQKRVSNLTRLIAQEMGLPNDIVDTIRMASLIHDIGKLSVPAEILSKPTKLTDIEFSLIKIHSQAGYDILKDVDLPYPIAEMVLQHHEKLDGSGYPNGLKDGQILPEACILAVADVVEAMVSHRPYRTAFNVNVALDEIKKNRVILYDAAVVDACVKLFQEKGFSFV